MIPNKGWVSRQKWQESNDNVPAREDFEEIRETVLPFNWAFVLRALL